MNSNENISIDGYEVGMADFENYWGETLSEVEIIHFISGLVDTNEKVAVRKVFYNVPDKTKVSDVLSFPHINGHIEQYDFWRVTFTTASGKVYKSKNRFYCSLSKSDKNRVILGVNGDAKTLYVAFPSSSSCSTALNLV